MSPFSSSASGVTQRRERKGRMRDAQENWDHSDAFLEEQNQHLDNACKSGACFYKQSPGKELTHRLYTGDA